MKKYPPRMPILYLLFALAIALNITFWFQTHDEQATWNNVPKAPGIFQATAMTLGDQQLAYRSNGVMLQNLGDTGGRTTNLADYNYKSLSGWFTLMDHLDPHSNFSPFLAAYYFGVVDDPAKAKYVVDYLETIGSKAEGQAWRWLARAAYLARYNQKDMDRALEIANHLADIAKTQSLPFWASQMPIFILNAKGEKQAARAIIEETLKSGVDVLHPNEVNAMIAYLCETILHKDEAEDHLFCQSTKRKK